MQHSVFVISILFMRIVMSFCVEININFEWRYVDYVWESQEQKQQAIDSGNYNASACILYDVDKASDGRTFVTSVRRKGVPASLMTVSNERGDGGPFLRPYPDWSWHRNKKCEGITGVYRMYIKCNHLFVLDCGKIGDEKVCSAQLLIFDLRTDKLVKRIIIPDEVATNKNGTGLLVTLVVLTPHCKNVTDTAIVFMADTLGYGLVTWNAYTSKFSRTESDFMKPTDPVFIDGHFILYDFGILGLTTIYEDLYYASLSGKKIFKMKISDILQYSLNISEANNLTQTVRTLKGQTGPIASIEHTIFFSNVPETSIMCTNIFQRINSNNMVVIAQDPETLQSPSGMKVTVDFERLMILTNRYQHVAIVGSLNLQEINFRIISISIAEIRKETGCFVSYMP